MGTHKPKWRNELDSDEVPKPTIKEYWDQVSSYAQMSMEFVRADSAKLKQLIDSLDSLPEPALHEVLAFAESEAVTSLPDERRLPVWVELSSLARKHRRYADAQWALPAEIVDKIERVASVLAPQDPTVKYRVIFAKNTWNLHDDEKDWQESEARLAQRRTDAIQEIFGISGVEGVMAFATQVEDPYQVGFALGKLDLVNFPNDLLRKTVHSSDPKWRELVKGFALAMWQRVQWTWFDGLNIDSWSKDEIAQLLTYLPFDSETWKRADRLLGDGAKEYWTRVPVRVYQRDDPDYVAVDALLTHGRPRAAVACLASRVHEKRPLDSSRAMEALRGAATSNEPGTSVDHHASEMIIKALQDDGNVDRSKLMQVEWAYLALLEHSHVTTAKTLNAAIATDPNFFCEIIRTIFRSDRERGNSQRPEPTEEQRGIARNAYRLLQGWSTVPGTEASGSICADFLRSWIDKVKDSLADSGHLDVGLQKAGEAFIHSPADPDGLFMNHAVADVLNREDMEELRVGYRLAVYNSRGVHRVDPTGAPEKELYATFTKRAEEVENAGYHRLAVTLRLIADGYSREAESIIAESAAEDRQNEE